MAISASAQDAERLMKASDCFSCHAVDHQVVGPAYNVIAKRHEGQSDAGAKLSAKIRDGGSGMTPHPKLTDAQRQEMATWILAQVGSGTSAAPGESKTYPYRLKDGTAIVLDFPLFVSSQDLKVTKEVFHGYQFYNSYCYRCHGTDANGGELAPDLRHSVAGGTDQHNFLSVAMSGKQDEGMPAWAGFLTEEDVVDIFRYVKGRSLGLVASGRPPSAQD